MNKEQAQQNIKILQSECAKLNPSSLIELFEIDLTSVANDLGISSSGASLIFRFHNQIKLVTTSIFWQEKEYVAAPISANGFEITSQGTLPTPKLNITVSEAGIPLLSALKNYTRVLGDLVGSKVTRKRTFARFLDASNFNENNLPADFSPNPLIEFPYDIYYINRKSKEDKYTIEYELNSVLDLEGINLPRRQILSKRCVACYRGEGCLYEYNIRRNDDIHGEFAILPNEAPPVATEDNSLITDLLGISNITVIGQYTLGTQYQKGQSVYIIIDGIKYYFVAKNDNVTTAPPNSNDWIEDKCSKEINGCVLRWGTNGYVNVYGTQLTKGQLPFVGFPSTQRIGRGY